MNRQDELILFLNSFLQNKEKIEKEYDIEILYIRDHYPKAISSIIVFKKTIKDITFVFLISFFINHYDWIEVILDYLITTNSDNIGKELEYKKQLINNVIIGDEFLFWYHNIFFQYLQEYEFLKYKLEGKHICKIYNFSEYSNEYIKSIICNDCKKYIKKVLFYILSIVYREYNFFTLDNKLISTDNEDFALMTKLYGNFSMEFPSRLKNK